MRKTSRILLTMLLCLILSTVLLNGQACAADIVASGTCVAQGDNLVWTLDSDGVITISGTGKMADYFSSNRTWQSYLDQITIVVIGSGVTTVGDFAFHSCSDCLQSQSLTASPASGVTHLLLVSHSQRSRSRKAYPASETAFLPYVRRSSVEITQLDFG